MQLYFFCYIFCLQVFWCGLCVCTGSYFLAACHISVTCFCKGSVYYFSVFDLHLQSYLFQFCCIFLICLRSFIMTIFIETFTWTISYLLIKLKDVCFSSTCCRTDRVLSVSLRVCTASVWAQISRCFMSHWFVRVNVLMCGKNFAQEAAAYCSLLSFRMCGVFVLHMGFSQTLMHLHGCDLHGKFQSVSYPQELSSMV